MNPFHFLGVAADADPATIKRAYAGLLRKHRPDDDPDGFQRVHDAYRTCLAHAERMAAKRSMQPPGLVVTTIETATMPAAGVSAAADTAPEVVPDATERPVATGRNSGPAIATASATRPPAARPAGPVWGAPPAVVATPRHRIGFPLQDFVKALCEKDREGPDPLQSWLEACEPLYSIDLKQAIAAPLVQSLLGLAEPLSLDGLRVVLRFFALDTIGPLQRTLAGSIEKLEGRSHAAWSVRQPVVALSRPQPPGRRARAEQASWTQQLVNRELTSPRKFWRRALILLLPKPNARMSATLARLRSNTDLANDPTFVRESVLFWLRVMDPLRSSPWQMLPAAIWLVPFLALLMWMLGGMTTAAVTSGTIGIVAYLIGHLLMQWSKRRRAAALCPPATPGRRERFAARELVQPRNLGRRAFILIGPGFKGPMRRALRAARLEHEAHDARAGSSPFDTRAIAFWDKALDRNRMHVWRMFSTFWTITWATAAAVCMLLPFTQWAVAPVMFFIFVPTIYFGWFLLAWNDLSRDRAAARAAAGKKGAGKWLWPLLMVVLFVTHLILEMYKLRGG